MVRNWKVEIRCRNCNSFHMTMKLYAHALIIELFSLLKCMKNTKFYIIMYYSHMCLYACHYGSCFRNISRSAQEPLSPDYFEKAVHTPQKRCTARACVPHTVCAVASKRLKTVQARSMKDWSLINKYMCVCVDLLYVVFGHATHTQIYNLSIRPDSTCHVYWKCKLRTFWLFHYMHCQRNVDEWLKI